MDKEIRMEILEKYKKAEKVGEVFDLVKTVVKEFLNKERAGLMFGLSDLGVSNSYWAGAYWMIGSNVIIISSVPLKKIEDTNPELFKPYMLHILLHEYLHSLGVLDESRNQALTQQISIELFGENHIVTKMVDNISKFLPNISYSGLEWDPKDSTVTLISDFDKSNTRYIG